MHIDRTRRLANRTIDLRDLGDRMQEAKVWIEAVSGLLLSCLAS